MNRTVEGCVCSAVAAQARLLMGTPIFCSCVPTAPSRMMTSLAARRDSRLLYSLMLWRSFVLLLGMSVDQKRRPALAYLPRHRRCDSCWRESAPQGRRRRLDAAALESEAGLAVASEQQRAVEIDPAGLLGDQQCRRHGERGADHAADH